MVSYGVDLPAFMIRWNRAPIKNKRSQSASKRVPGPDISNKRRMQPAPTREHSTCCMTVSKSRSLGRVTDAFSTRDLGYPPSLKMPMPSEVAKVRLQRYESLEKDIFSLADLDMQRSEFGCTSGGYGSGPLRSTQARLIRWRGAPGGATWLRFRSSLDTARMG